MINNGIHNNERNKEMHGFTLYLAHSGKVSNNKITSMTIIIVFLIDNK